MAGAMAAAPRARILVVDDEPDIRTGLQALLGQSLPAEVVEASSGEAGLAALRGGSFHAILSDYKMPGGMDGLAFLGQAQQLAPRTPRIMMTAFPDMELAIQALNDARILHFFTKPVDPQHLIDVLRTIIAAEDSLRQRDDALRRSLEMMKRKGAAKPGRTP